MSLDEQRARRREPEGTDTASRKLPNMHLNVEITLPGTDDRADQNALSELYGLPAGTHARVRISSRPPDCRTVGMLHGLMRDQQLVLSLLGSPSALRAWWGQLAPMRGDTA